MNTRTLIITAITLIVIITSGIGLSLWINGANRNQPAANQVNLSRQSSSSSTTSSTSQSNTTSEDTELDAIEQEINQLMDGSEFTDFTVEW